MLRSLEFQYISVQKPLFLFNFLTHVTNLFKSKNITRIKVDANLKLFLGNKSKKLADDLGGRGDYR